MSKVVWTKFGLNLEPEIQTLNRNQLFKSSNKNVGKYKYLSTDSSLKAPSPSSESVTSSSVSDSVSVSDSEPSKEFLIW